MLQLCLHLVDTQGYWQNVWIHPMLPSRSIQFVLQVAKQSGKTALVLLWLSFVGFGQPSLLLARGVVLPWLLPAVDPQIKGQIGEVAEPLAQQLARSLLQDPRQANTEAPDNTSQNRLRALGKIILGDAAQLTPEGEALAFQPIVCRFPGELLIMLEVTGLGTRMVRLIVQERLPLAEEVVHAGEKELLQAAVLGGFQRLSRTVLERLPQDPAPTGPLKLALIAKKQNFDLGGSSSDCLNSLLASGLAATGLRVLSSHSHRALETLASVRADIPPRARANRSFVLDWRRQPGETLQFQLGLAFYGAVFGDPIAKIPYFLVDYRDAGLVLNLPAELVQLLANEQDSLDPSQNPTIVKIHRAWAYLDKGRGYGLQIGDRLVLAEAPRRVKGHIIGFYGPTEGLQSPAGYRVNEGAILFVRRGQRFTRMGQQLIFDPTQYPTPWPPVATP